MERKSTSLIIYGFVLITFLYFIPSCQASRKLADASPPNTPFAENYQHDDQSKSGVHDSVSDNDGSATGDTPPSENFNRPPAPTSYYNQNRGYTQQTSYNSNCRVVETVDAYGNRQTVVTGNGCNNSGYEGQQNVGGYYAPPPPVYSGYPYYYPPSSGYGNSNYP